MNISDQPLGSSSTAYHMFLRTAVLLLFFHWQCTCSDYCLLFWCGCRPKDALDDSKKGIVCWSDAMDITRSVKVTPCHFSSCSLPSHHVFLLLVMYRENRVLKWYCGCSEIRSDSWISYILLMCIDGIGCWSKVFLLS